MTTKSDMTLFPTWLSTVLSIWHDLQIHLFWTHETYYLMAWQTLVWYWRSRQTSGEVVVWLCAHPSIVQGEISPALLCKAIICSTSVAEEVNHRCIWNTTLGTMAADAEMSPLQSGNDNTLKHSTDKQKFCSATIIKMFNMRLCSFNPWIMDRKVFYFYSIGHISYLYFF